jgi:hypothetical protein
MIGWRRQASLRIGMVGDTSGLGSRGRPRRMAKSSAVSALLLRGHAIPEMPAKMVGAALSLQSRKVPFCSLLMPCPSSDPTSLRRMQGRPAPRWGRRRAKSDRAVAASASGGPAGGGGRMATMSTPNRRPERAAMATRRSVSAARRWYHALSVVPAVCQHASPHRLPDRCRGRRGANRLRHGGRLRACALHIFPPYLATSCCGSQILCHVTPHLALPSFSPDQGSL